MLLNARTKYNTKKTNQFTANTFKISHSFLTNPQIGAFYDKLESISNEPAQPLWNPLNLVRWEKVKYKPTESQNRIRIQNRISLKKASQQKVRPRAKPVKRMSLSTELIRNQHPTDYKEHYQQIMSTFTLKRQHTEDLESEIDQLEIIEMPSSSEGFRFKERLKKYKNVVSYIEERIQSKNSCLKQRKRPFYSQKTFGPSQFDSSSPSKRMNCTTKTIIAKNQEEDCKIESIMQKWKPPSKIDKKFEATSSKHYPRKKMSSALIHQPLQLPINSPRYIQHNNQTSVALSQQKCLTPNNS